MKSLLPKDAPSLDQSIENLTDKSVDASNDTSLSFTPRREIRAQSQALSSIAAQSNGPAARFSLDDNASVSVDSLAKFLDQASQWSTDAGMLEQQSKKGIVTRAATEGLRQL